MVKRHIEETTEEFNENGVLISRVTTITDEEDDNLQVYETRWVPCNTDPGFSKTVTWS